MNQREKILAIAVGVFSAGFLGYLSVKGLLLEPAAKADREIARLSSDIDTYAARNGKLKSYQASLTAMWQKTLGDDPDVVSETVRDRLTQVLERTALTGNLTLQPLPVKLNRDYYKEIGWRVQAEGPLSSVVNFLYLLEGEPYLHRVDDLEVVPTQNRPVVRMQIRYVTLIFPSPAGAASRPASQPSEIRPSVDLDDPIHDKYQVIVSRDLFRPYIPRPPAPTPVAAPNNPPAPQPEAPSESRFVVVGLPSWGQEEDINVRDDRSRAFHRYKIGDSLAGGTIAMIDYTPMPLPGEPEKISTSRVIIKIGQEYWAIELGQNFGQKHRLKPSDLPEKLRGATSAPAAAAMAGGSE